MATRYGKSTLAGLQTVVPAASLKINHLTILSRKRLDDGSPPRKRRT